MLKPIAGAGKQEILRILYKILKILRWQTYINNNTKYQQYTQTNKYPPADSITCSLGANKKQWAITRQTVVYETEGLNISKSSLKRQAVNKQVPVTEKYQSRYKRLGNFKT